MDSSSSTSNRVTDTKGKFIGGAAAARRGGVKSKARKGIKIVNPMVRENLRVGISTLIHPQERFIAAILRTIPRDIMKSYSFPQYREQLRLEMCQRVYLPPLEPLQSIYKNMQEHKQRHACMILEEARHVIADALFRRWGRDRIPSERGGIPMEFVSHEKMKASEHLVYYFRSKCDITSEMKSNLRPGTVVELMPLGQNTIEAVVLGNIVRCTPKGISDMDDVEIQRQLAVMIYNTSGEKFDGDVRLVPLESLLNLTRQFDVCTTGNNDLNGELLGVRRKAPVHTIFSHSESSDDGEDRIEIDSKNSSRFDASTKQSIGRATDGLERRKLSQRSSICQSDQSPEQEHSNVVTECRNSLLRDDGDVEALRALGFRVPKLNITQQKAAKAFLDSQFERISIVQGPPGTGKTTLLVGVICHYLLRARREKRSKRLLVCAPTNKAVNVLAVRVLDAIHDDLVTSTVLIGDQERLLAENRLLLRRHFVYTWRNAIVEDWDHVARDLNQTKNMNNLDGLVRWAHALLKRVKHQLSGLLDEKIRVTMSMIASGLEELSATTSDVLAVTKSKLIDDIRSLVNNLNALEEEHVVRTLLADADIIFCTLSSAGAQVMKTTVAVDDIIVDEAAAATEPELCIGLWLVNNRLLLVGDPHQLPATVNSEYCKENGLDKSLQDRLMNNCGFHFTMLDTQYRMKKEISSFPFRAFYNANVKDGENVLESTYEVDFAILNKQPFAFLQVQGGEHKDTYGSTYNPAECDAVVKILLDIRSRGRHLGKDWSNVNRIRVITFYQAQVNEIQKRLRRFGLHNVFISTVDSSQGCESDIVIISFVRGEKIGFLSDFRRVNVALTRAKYQLICVGDARIHATLTNGKATFISQLAKDAFERDCVVDDYTPEPFFSDLVTIQNGGTCNDRPPGPRHEFARDTRARPLNRSLGKNAKKRTFVSRNNVGHGKKSTDFRKKVKTNR